MKKFYLVAALLGMVYSVSPAQSKLTMADRAVLNELRMTRNLSGQEGLKNTRSVAAGAVPVICAIVEIAPGYNAEDLAAAGAEVNTVVDEFATVTLPVASVEEFSANAAVKRMQLDRVPDLKNDRARTNSKVHQIHAKHTLEQAYTGAGVIAGVYDIGVDPHHPAFKTADRSASRIQRLFFVTDSDNDDGIDIRTYSGTGDTQTADGEPIEDLSLFSTDTNQTSHGTHTTATVAGGKGGSSTYYGMAYDADIAIACGGQSIASIVNGFAAIAEYALEAGKPVVINCSMGINTGSHDGTDVYSRIIDRIVEKSNAIICLSAGNEGDMDIAWHHKFDEPASLTTGFKELGSIGEFAGTTEFWGNGAQPFKVTIAMADVTTGALVETLATVDKSTDGSMTYFSTPNVAEALGGSNTSATLNKYWTTAYYGIGSAVDEANGRYVTMLQYSFARPTDDLKNNTYRYIPVFIVEGNAGQEVWGYCSGRYETLSSRGVAGWTGGTANGSINNLACTKSVISVGAYVNRNSYKATDGSTYRNSNKVNAICDFSSYGDIADGRSLPDVCAPGSFLLSAISSPYWNGSYNSTKDANGNVVKRYTKANSAQYEAVDGRINAYGDMQGTSMSCPVVTGSMALWKQANPDLTVEEAREIIKETAVAVVSDNPTQWGAGRFDAIAGLKKVLEKGNAGVDALEQNARLIVTTTGEKSFEVYVAGETSLKAVLYNMSGNAVLMASASGDTMPLDASALGSGVYVLSVEGTTTHYSQRILVK